MGSEINTVTISGNLTRDPELRSTHSGTAVCSLRIANNQRRKVNGDWEDQTHYFDVTVWSGQGEWIAKNIGKGAKVVVSGNLEWREWEDKDGNKRQAVQINARDVVPEREGRGGGGGGGGGGFTPRSDIPRDEEPAPAAQQSRPVDPADDDIPF